MLPTVVVTGANGLLGAALCRLMQPRYRVHALVHQATPALPPGLAGVHEADVRDADRVRALLYALEPSAVFHTAAYTAVDRAESERQVTWATNVLGTAHVAQVCRELGAGLIHLSTDYVFDGAAGPYREGDRPNPVSYYGLSKLWSERMAEKAGPSCLVARTTVLYGVGPKLDFVSWIVRELGAGRLVRVVTDQYGSPTLNTDLVQALISLWELGVTGLLHVTGQDWLNRYDFACRIAAHFGLNPDLILPITSAALQQPAARPLLGGLVCDQVKLLLGRPLLGVTEGLNALKDASER